MLCAGFFAVIILMIDYMLDDYARARRHAAHAMPLLTYALPLYDDYADAVVDFHYFFLFQHARMPRRARITPARRCAHSALSLMRARYYASRADDDGVTPLHAVTPRARRAPPARATPPLSRH